MKILKSYYKLPISNIPFKEIPSLELISYEYVICSFVPLNGFTNVNHGLVSIYDAFGDQVINLSELENRELLFGEIMVSDTLPPRGKSKC